MKLIVGLSNPEPQYANTRHNLGSMAVRLLARAEAESGSVSWDNWRSVARLTRLQLKGQEFKLALPLSYMNESGPVVAQLVNFFKINLTDLWLVHDDIDLPFGAMRLAWQSSSAGHRGVDSVMASLGTADFWRFRLGVGRPPEHLAVDQYVLQSFTEPEQTALPVFLSRAVTRLKLVLIEGPRSV